MLGKMIRRFGPAVVGDLCAVAGSVNVIVGSTMIYGPLGWIMGGAALLTIAVLIARR